MASPIFVVVEENSENEDKPIQVYPNAYTTFELAVKAVKTEHEELDQEANKEALESFDSKKGYNYIYIEKGIHIKIYQLPIISNSSSGGGKNTKHRRKLKKGKTRRFRKN
jgi:hypothetical protein